MTYGTRPSAQRASSEAGNDLHLSPTHSEATASTPLLARHAHPGTSTPDHSTTRRNSKRRRITAYLKTPVPASQYDADYSFNGHESASDGSGSYSRHIAIQPATPSPLDPQTYGSTCSTQEGRYSEPDSDLLRWLASSASQNYSMGSDEASQRYMTDSDTSGEGEEYYEDVGRTRSSSASGRRNEWLLFLLGFSVAIVLGGSVLIIFVLLNR